MRRVSKTPRDIKCFLTKPSNKEPGHYWPVIGRRLMDRDAGGEKKSEEEIWREEGRTRWTAASEQ